MTTRGIRLQKAISQAGLVSRRRAETLIGEGRVKVNGRVIAAPGTCLLPGDRLEVDGRTVTWAGPRATEVWALYKPRGCVTTLHDPEGRPTVQDHLPRSRQRLFPVGRLDYDAEGLLLLTNDGELAQRIAHPAHAVAKVYLVKVKGLVEREALARLARGPTLAGRRRRPVRARVLHTLVDKTWLEVTLREGVNRQIKKMFGELGYPVLKIKRYRIGPVTLEDMKPGQSRLLGKAEVARLVEGSPAPASADAAGEIGPTVS
ncbi:MAG: rRNA pseudouridine synthase [Candidatus Lambdaproteobacteria bacterium]|nr:rRNA pseudouridine synthase [Candidatus Lambdaproteobacteria bacterium]